MKKQLERKTHVLDANNKAVGRLATEVAIILSGKNKATYLPYVEAGDLVKIINASKLRFTGNKLVQKDYRHHSMHPGGLKVVSMKKVFDKNPAKVIRHAVNGMLPKNRQRTKLLQRLVIEN